jgi:hypothetical protein
MAKRKKRLNMAEDLMLPESTDTNMLASNPTLDVAPYGYATGTNTPITEQQFNATENERLKKAGMGIYAQQQPFVPASQSNFAAQNPGTPAMTETPSYDLKNVGAADVTMGVNKAIQQQNEMPAAAIVNEPVAEPAAQSAAVEQTSGTEFDPAFSLQESAILNMQKAGMAKAAATESYFQERQKITEREAEKASAAQSAFDLEWNRKTKEYDDTVAEMKAASNDKVIPGAYLARQDTSGALATGIAVALGAFAATAAGTSTNLGLEMINKAIDRDVEAQKFNIDNKLKSKAQELTAQNTLLARMKDKYGLDADAAKATKAAMYEQVESKMKEQLARTSMPLEAKALAQEQLAKIKAKRIEIMAELKKSNMMAAAMAADDDGNLTPDQVFARYGKERAGLYVPGLGMAHSLEISKVGTEKILPVKGTLAKIKDVIDFAKGKEYSRLSPSDRGIMQAKIRAVQLELKNKQNFELGVLTGPDMGLLEAVTGDPNKVFTLVNQNDVLGNLYKSTEDAYYQKVKDFFPQSKLNASRQQAKSALKYTK